MKQIIYCRLYLGVTMLSNITLADSETLNPHMRSGNITLLGSSAKHLLAKQGYPNWKSWKSWSKCLELFANSNQLKVPLKQCHVPISTDDKTHNNNYVASDGSASEEENTLSFGWVISLLDSTTLATHSGPAFGQASLLQAEGYGLLSVTHFLYQLQIYTQLTPACNVCIYTDNKEVVTGTNNQIQYEYDYPYNTLEPDWDFIAQLAEYLQALGSKLKIEHVKSHQDDNYNFEQLDLPAQLNVQADELVRTYRAKYSQPQAVIH
eukprot:15344294-Ditylum_brightwellii.AAC.1